MLLFKPPCLAHAYSVFKNDATCEANVIKTLQKPHLIPHIMYQIHYKQGKKKQELTIQIQEPLYKHVVLQNFLFLVIYLRPYPSWMLSDT